MKWLAACLLVVMSALPAWAEYPTVENRGTNAGDSSATTSHAVTLGGVASGRLLLVVAACRDASQAAPTWTAGWTPLVSQQSDDTTSAGSWHIAAYKVSNGSETTVTITTANSVACAWLPFSISGQHTSTPIEATADGRGGISTVPGVQHTASWGVEDTLWIAAIGMSTNAAINTYPTNYSNSQTAVSTTGTNARVGTAEREQNSTAAETPDNFVLASSNHSAVSTIAIRPAGASGGGGVIGGGLGGPIINAH